tara:strand:+ start:3259 stop:3696 length:438 start_codon:yes stop_codon:yes gene_type:complete
MKYFLILFFISFSIFSQSDSSYYGEKISSSDLQQLSKIDFNNEFVQTKLEGEIISTCPKKGCWIEMKIDDKDVFVKFKDYDFFVPKSGMEGKKAIIQGLASIDTVSIKDLKHYAEDAGKSKSEIEKIISPEIKISFLAKGVVIKD